MHVAKAHLILSFSFETSLDYFDLGTVGSPSKEQLTENLNEPLVVVVVVERDDPALYPVPGHAFLTLSLCWI